MGMRFEEAPEDGCSLTGLQAVQHCSQNLVRSDHTSELRSKDAKLRPREVPMSANSSSSIVRFGTFEVNLQTGELRRRGQRVKLQEHPLHVLVALLERPGEIITRAVLLGELCPAHT